MADIQGHRVILVPHPGPEAGPDRGTTSCPWPLDRCGDDCTEHQRKFLSTQATYLTTVDGTPKAGLVGVWCEHEASTKVRKTGVESPRWTHDIDASAIERTRPEGHLNTDPWIWAPGFIWTICRQTKRHGPEIIRSLVPGDLVVFGSSLNGQWVLDTVMVVGLPRQRVGNLVGAGHSYDHCVVRTLPAMKKSLRPTQGIAWGDGSPFSFAPVSIDVKPRPRVAITELLRVLAKDNGDPPSKDNSQSLVACTRSAGNVVFWGALARATLAAGFGLGVKFEYPLDKADR